jgi:hypothetical protein
LVFEIDTKRLLGIVREGKAEGYCCGDGIHSESEFPLVPRHRAIVGVFDEAKAKTLQVLPLLGELNWLLLFRS